MWFSLFSNAKSYIKEFILQDWKAFEIANINCSNAKYKNHSHKLNNTKNKNINIYQTESPIFSQNLDENIQVGISNNKTPIW